MKNVLRSMMVLLGIALSVHAISAAKYVKVTDTADLQSNDLVVLGCASKGKANGSITGTYLAAVDATFRGDTLICNGATDLTLQGSGASWNFYVGTSLLGATAEKALSTDAGDSGFASGWTVSIESDGTASILLKTPKFKDTRLQYNASSPRFCNYATNQTGIQIYKKVIVSEQVLEVSGSLNLGNIALVDGEASASSSLTISGENLTEAITYSLSDATHFAVTGSLTAAGGALSVAFSATEEGSYTTSLTLTSGAVSKTVTLSATVVAAPAGDNSSFGLVTDASQLMSGAEVLFVSEENGKVAGALASQILGAEDVTIANHVIASVPAGATVFTLGGTTGAWTFSTTDGALGATAVKKLAYAGGTTTWSIAIDASGNATITNGTSTYGTMCYNTSSPRFTTYAAPSAACILPQLYMRGAQVTPTSVENTESATAAQKILRDGRIYILREGLLYDLNGRRVE